jgi:hypothetical protein
VTRKPGSSPNPDTPSPAQSREWQQRDRVWKCGLESRDKMVLLAFLDYDRSADGADLFPSLRRIADYTGCSYRSVRRAKDALEEMGVLEVVGHVSSRYELRGHVAKYRFHPERLPTGPSRPRRRQRLAARSVSRDNRTPCPLVEPSTMGHAVTTRGQLDADKGPIRRRQEDTVATDRTYDRTDRTDRRTPRASHARLPSGQKNHDDEGLQALSLLCGAEGGNGKRRRRLAT